MNELLELYDDIIRLADDVKIKNDTENPYVDAYNQCVDAMLSQIRYHINAMGLVKAFGSNAFGGEK